MSKERRRFIFDAGTGIRELGNEILSMKKPVDCHIFFSHFHWDHIQGLPFFGPAFDPRYSITFYSPVPEFQSILEGQMKPPYFPITMDVMSAAKEFRILEGDPVSVGGVRISYRAMSHPGGCYSYAIEEDGIRAIYSTDTELREDDFSRTPENKAYFQDADILVLDTQYTLGEAIEKYNWGHSSFSLASDFAATWGIKKLVLFHHEPSYSDLKVESIFKNAVMVRRASREQGDRGIPRARGSRYRGLAMDDFTLRMDLKSALRLYVFLEAREDELAPGAAELYASLRAYLYDRLSIGEMESPKTLLAKLDEL